MVERVPRKVAAKAAAKRKQPDEATASGSMPILPAKQINPNLELAATVAAGGDGLVVVSEKKTKEAKGGSKYKRVRGQGGGVQGKSSIRINHREVHLSYYDSELEAARARQG